MVLIHACKSKSRKAGESEVEKVQNPSGYCRLNDCVKSPLELQLSCMHNRTLRVGL